MNSNDQYHNELYIIEINKNDFDFSKIEWYKFKPSMIHKIIAVKFRLAENVEKPSIEILNDIGTRLTEEKGPLNGIFFYAEKSGTIYNLFAFSNKIPSITNFASNILRGVMIPIRVHFSGTKFYLMVKRTKLGKYENYTGLLQNDESYENAARRELKKIIIVDDLNCNFSEIGTDNHLNYAFLHGKWELHSKIFVVDIKLTHVSQLNSLINSETIFIEENKFDIAITKFTPSVDIKNDDELRELVRQVSESNDEFYGRTSVPINSRRFLDYHLDIVKCLTVTKCDRYTRNYKHDENHEVNVKLFNRNN